MMRELVATTTVLRTFSTGRPDIRTVRNGKLKTAALFLFLLEWLGCAAACIFQFQSTRNVKTGYACSIKLQVVQVPSTLHCEQRKQS